MQNSVSRADESALQAVEEEASLPKSRVEDDSEMDITPMIDMTFLLLIFFIVCSKMDAGASITLPPAKHGDAVASEHAIVFTVGLRGDETQFYKGKGKVEANRFGGGSPAETENEAAAYVEEQLTLNPDLTNVIIMAEAGVKHRDVSLVMKGVGAAQAEGNQLHVAVMEVR